MTKVQKKPQPKSSPELQFFSSHGIPIFHLVWITNLAEQGLSHHFFHLLAVLIQGASASMLPPEGAGIAYLAEQW